MSDPSRVSPDKVEQTEESLAMNRAEEALYINTRPAIGHTTDQGPQSPLSPALELAENGVVPLPAVPAHPSAGWARVLRLVALAAAIAAVVATFWSSFRERPASTTMMVVVRSTPPGATVEINDVERGVTPALVEVECSSRGVTLTLRKKGFAPWVQPMPCYGGTETRIDRRLMRER